MVVTADRRMQRWVPEDDTGYSVIVGCLDSLTHLGWSVEEEEDVVLGSGWMGALSGVLGQWVAHWRRKLGEQGGVEGSMVAGSGRNGRERVSNQEQEPRELDVEVGHCFIVSHVAWMPSM